MEYISTLEKCSGMLENKESMIKIRLSRTGKKRQPSYRVVVADIRSKRDGRVVERIGHFNPLTNPETYAIREDRALHWLSVGAQPTDAVRRLLEKQGTFDRLKRLHAGEAFDALVAEYSGEPVAAEVEETAEVVAEAEAELVEEDTEAETEAEADEETVEDGAEE